MKYVIVPVGEVTNAMVNLSIGNQNFRCDKYETKVVIKFNESDSVARDVFKNYLWLDKATIRAKLETEEWCQLPGNPLLRWWYKLLS